MLKFTLPIKGSTLSVVDGESSCVLSVKPNSASTKVSVEECWLSWKTSEGMQEWRQYFIECEAIYDVLHTPAPPSAISAVVIASSSLPSTPTPDHAVEQVTPLTTSSTPTSSNRAVEQVLSPKGRRSSIGNSSTLIKEGYLSVSADAGKSWTLRLGTVNSNSGVMQLYAEKSG